MSGIAFALILLFANGCGSDSTGISPISFCEYYVPVLYSSEDTEETIEDILHNNVLYHQFCED